MSGIEWTEDTWNPVVGCSKVSQGCKNCYALTQFPRFRNRFGYGDKFTDVKFLPNRLQKPLLRKKPTLWFVNSMSDLFHEDVSFSEITQIFEVIKKADWHTFQILTKRPERMLEYFLTREVPKNVWLGVSVEDKRDGVPRIQDLQLVDAKVRFLSIEPLIGDVGKLNLDGIHWVIIGGESGKGARPMKPDWARSVRDQCIAAGVPLIFKQWGCWGEDGIRRNKKDNGRLLDGYLWDEYPKSYKPKQSVLVRAPVLVSRRIVRNTRFKSVAAVDKAVLDGLISFRSGAAYRANLTMKAQARMLYGP
jgi:protein gp37